MISIIAINHRSYIRGYLYHLFLGDGHRADSGELHLGSCAASHQVGDWMGKN
jgi:hypothetical protein